jgi:hypothetical protein
MVIVVRELSVIDMPLRRIGHTLGSGCTRTFLAGAEPRSSLRLLTCETHESQCVGMEPLQREKEKHT